MTYEHPDWKIQLKILKGQMDAKEKQRRLAKKQRDEEARRAALEACGPARPTIDYHKAGGVWQGVWEIQGGLPSLGKDQ